MTEHKDNYRLVYSDTPQPPKKSQHQSAAQTNQAVMRLERKGRAGKSVTIIDRLRMSDDELKVILKELQQACGTGGTVKDHHLELQGDVRLKVKPLLLAQGIRVA